MSTSPSSPGRSTLAQSPTRISVTDDLDLLLGVLSPPLRAAIERCPDRDALIEVVLDLGRIPEARFPDRVQPLSDAPFAAADLRAVVERVGRFGQDNRAGIERTLHRISAIRNRGGDVVGLTCRVGRAVLGTVEILRDVIESGWSILLLGRPGVGKTTLLREAARVLADDLDRRVVVVDTSNEIAGDGDIPHPGIGRARRMQVRSPDHQHAVMIEAIENHMPEVIVIDEIGTAADALAARTIAERGVQLIATAHGNTLDNLMQNPTLADLIGGLQAVTLSDEQAMRRGTQKTVLERKAPPTFDVVIEIQDQDRLAVYEDVARVVDEVLLGEPLRPQLRRRRPEGGFAVENPERDPRRRPTPPAAEPGPTPPRRRTRAPSATRPLRIFPFAVSRGKLERAIRDLHVPATVVQNLGEADVVLTLRAQERRQPRRIREAQARGVRLAVVRSNSVKQIEDFVRDEFDLHGFADDHQLALDEVERALDRVLDDGQPVELSPQDRFTRRLQHEFVHRFGLASESQGQEPYRRVVVYPHG